MSHEDLKSSAHVWGDGEGAGSAAPPPTSPSPPSQSPQPASTPADAPPAYTSASDSHATASRAQPHVSYNPLTELASMATIPFQQYQVPSSTRSADRITLTTTHQPFISRPESLANFINQQAQLPPKPALHVTGTHKEGSGANVTDFDLTLSLLPLLSLTTPPPSHPFRLRFTEPPRSAAAANTNKLFKSSSIRSSEPTPLQAWARHFCIVDKSENRSLTLTRTILDFDTLTSMLEGNVRTLLASLGYRGKLEVSFPLAYRDVVVHKRAGNWLVGLLGIYPVKKYEVAEAVWELRGYEGEVGAGSKIAESWWREWEGPLREAVLGKTKGSVGVEEWVAWRMGERRDAKKGEWGVDWWTD